MMDPQASKDESRPKCSDKGIIFAFRTVKVFVMKGDGQKSHQGLDNLCHDFSNQFGARFGLGSNLGWDPTMVFHAVTLPHLDQGKGFHPNFEANFFLYCPPLAQGRTILIHFMRRYLHFTSEGSGI